MERQTIDVGNVEHAIEVVFKADRDDRRYVLQPKDKTAQYGYAEDYLAFLERFKKYEVRRTNEHYIDDESGQWFAFYNVDCFDPPFAIIRSRTFEQAYEVFCDEFADWLKVDEISEPDYHTDECNANKHENCECDITYNSSGTHIDTDNVQGNELTLVSVSCEVSA